MTAPKQCWQVARNKLGSSPSLIMQLGSIHAGSTSSIITSSRLQSSKTSLVGKMEQQTFNLTDIIDIDKMANFDNEIENLVQKECECSDINSLNAYLKKHNGFILYVNIRSLNNNLEKLELLLNRLKRKPTVIV